ncbi:MAG: branched-chain amino acid ABC transporter permease [Fusobacteriaceae bacterium]|nr:branched-chain amino acid ABC transporter permease [Fusobacteriaceae bacterium]
MNKELVLFFQQLINALKIGSVYALVALGYTMVYGIIRLTNFAHGDFIMVGGYTMLFMMPVMAKMGIPVWCAVFIAIAICSCVGVTVEQVAYKPVRRSGSSVSALITAISVSLFMENMALLVVGGSPRSVPRIFRMPNVKISGVSVNGNSMLTIVIGLFVMICLTLFVRRTRAGKAMRAVSEDGQASILMGINLNRSITLTFAMGSGLAAVASMMYCTAYPQVQPFMGAMLGLKAYVAAVLGGIGIIPGAMLGGMVIGFVETMTKAYISSSYADAFVFAILIVVLLVKPAGILGKNIGEKV